LLHYPRETFAVNLTTRPSRALIVAAAIGGSALLIPSAALATTAAPATHARVARVAHESGPARVARVARVAAGHQSRPSYPQCKSGRTLTWIGLPGSGAAGTIYYPLEFTNVGSFTCWLYGYPGVSARSASGHKIGPSASASGRRHLVVLRPGATGHARLGITEARNIPRCKVQTAAWLKVFAPGQFRSSPISGFRFTACTNKRVLHVGPVRPGVGIPS
jgi:hypothetical protein